MTVEELRRSIVTRIDAILARPFLIWGGDRTLLTALRAYATVMPEAELAKVLSFMPATLMRPTTLHRDDDFHDLMGVLDGIADKTDSPLKAH